jgi:hypothetical protein
MASLGLSNQEADSYKEEMKRGRIVVIGTQKQSIPY